MEAWLLFLILDFFGFCWKPWEFFWVLTFGSIWSSPSLEIPSTPLELACKPRGSRKLLLVVKLWAIDQEKCQPDVNVWQQNGPPVCKYFKHSLPVGLGCFFSSRLAAANFFCKSVKIIVQTMIVKSEKPKYNSYLTHMYCYQITYFPFFVFLSFSTFAWLALFGNCFLS